jgi:hypothetical protein
MTLDVSVVTKYHYWWLGAAGGAIGRLAGSIRYRVLFL